MVGALTYSFDCSSAEPPLTPSSIGDRPLCGPFVPSFSVIIRSFSVGAGSLNLELPLLRTLRSLMEVVLMELPRSLAMGVLDLCSWTSLDACLNLLVNVLSFDPNYWRTWIRVCGGYGYNYNKS